MIGHFEIHLPQITLIRPARDDVIYRHHRREHRVILVIVAVHAVATDEEEIGNRVDVVTYHLQLIEAADIGRVSLGHP